MALMIRRLIPLNPKAFTFRSVQPCFPETGTSRTASFRSPNEFFSCAFSVLSDRNLSYQESLRSGLVEIKADDAVNLFQDMLRPRPLPTVINFNRLFSAVAKTKQYDLVLALCKQMELNGIAQDLITLNIMISCFCQHRKLQFACSVLGKIMKLGYRPDTVTFNTLINGFCLEGRFPEALELVNRMVGMKLRPHLILLSTLIDGLCLVGKGSEAVAASSIFKELFQELFQEMVSRGVHPNIVTPKILLDELCDSGLVPNGTLLQSPGGNQIQAELKSIIDCHLRDAFKVLGKEGTGFVAVADLRHILTSIGEKLEPSEFDEWIKEVDVGSDGKIRSEDFIARMVAK